MEHRRCHIAWGPVARVFPTLGSIPTMSKRLLVVTALCSALALAGCGGDDDEVASSVDPEPSAQTPTEEPEPESTPDAEGACAYVADGSPAAREVDLPPADPDFPDTLTIATDRGDIEVTLNADTPCTANNFASLAEQGYYDDTVCHRLVTGGIFVLQCGDPTATGSGGPGYTFGDELTGAEDYPAGTLAMANRGPDTNGSQFFIVFEPGGLGPLYTSFGTVDDDAVDLVAEIASEGNAPDGVAPATPVTIESVG